MADQRWLDTCRKMVCDIGHNPPSRAQMLAWVEASLASEDGDWFVEIYDRMDENERYQFLSSVLH